MIQVNEQSKYYRISGNHCELRFGSPMNLKLSSYVKTESTVKQI